MKTLLGFVPLVIACVTASQMTGAVPPRDGAGNDGTFVHIDRGTAGNPGHIAVGVNTGAPGGAFGAPGGPFDFHSLFNNYFAQMAKFHSDIANHGTDTYAFTTGDWKQAKAESSLSYDSPQSIQGLNAHMQQQQAQLANRIAGVGPPQGQGGQSFAFASGADGSDGDFSQGAFASGSIGDGGAYQTAAVFPENPGMPNVINRFSGGGAAAASGPGADGQPKFYGVMTSSSSHATNVDGKTQRQHVAETIVNDNGKITKYKVKDP